MQSTAWYSPVNMLQAETSAVFVIRTSTCLTLLFEFFMMICWEDRQQSTRNKRVPFPCTLQFDGFYIADINMLFALTYVYMQKEILYTAGH
jgi:hypothetical protein